MEVIQRDDSNRVDAVVRVVHRSELIVVSAIAEDCCSLTVHFMVFIKVSVEKNVPENLQEAVVNHSPLDWEIFKVVLSHRKANKDLQRSCSVSEEQLHVNYEI